MSEKTLGIIGGSGLYDLPGLEDRQEVEIETPFGHPSDAFVTGNLSGVKLAFLPRHGRGHRIAPNELPFRANMWGMKQLGMDCVVGVSAVGSMRETIRPGELVLVDQFIDRTRGRTVRNRSRPEAIGSQLLQPSSRQRLAPELLRRLGARPPEDPGLRAPGVPARG